MGCWVLRGPGGAWGLNRVVFHFFLPLCFLPLWLWVGVMGCCPTAALGGWAESGGHRVPRLSHPLQVSGAQSGKTQAGCLYLAPALGPVERVWEECSCWGGQIPKRWHSSVLSPGWEPHCSGHAGRSGHACVTPWRWNQGVPCLWTHTVPPTSLWSHWEWHSTVALWEEGCRAGRAPTTALLDMGWAPGVSPRCLQAKLCPHILHPQALHCHQHPSAGCAPPAPSPVPPPSLQHLVRITSHPTAMSPRWLSSCGDSTA